MENNNKDDEMEKPDGCLMEAKETGRGRKFNKTLNGQGNYLSNI
jgi:hypothetical protein